MNVRREIRPAGQIGGHRLKAGTRTLVRSVHDVPHRISLTNGHPLRGASGDAAVGHAGIRRIRTNATGGKLVHE